MFSLVFLFRYLEQVPQIWYGQQNGPRVTCLLVNCLLLSAPQVAFLAGVSAHSSSLQPTSATVFVVTAIHSEPCDSKLGNYFTTLALKNKEDYARLHGFGFFYSMAYVNPELRGPWNKIAVLQMLQEKLDRSRVEWLMWIDNDALFTNVTTVPPFSEYEGKDFVVWGDKHELFDNVDAQEGLNGGVMILRNNEWTRNFLADLAEYGKGWAWPGSRFKEVLEATVSSYHPGLYEQPAIAHWFKVNPRFHEKVYFENYEHLMLNVHYTWVPVSRHDKLNISHAYISDQTAYVVHFAGCQFCMARLNVLQATHCYPDFVKVFAFSYDRFQQIFKETPGFIVEPLLHVVEEHLAILHDSPPPLPW